VSDSYQTERTTVRRLAKRAAYDHETVHRILDEGIVAHVGFVADGLPCVIPMVYVRVNDTIFLHGSPASRLLRTLAEGVEACLTVTLIDGLVLARSAFHHSVNYRSAVVFGTAAAIEDPERKNEALRALSEHLVPGRWAEARVPSEAELKGTTVVALTVREASAKVRTGPPLDDKEDLALPVWAGVLPLRLAAGEPVADQGVTVPVPEYAANYRGPRGV
jgi:uncharacterized protein